MSVPIRPEPTVDVGLTGRELHVLTCAMAGNYPPSLRDVRMPTLRKLAKASRALQESQSPPTSQRVDGDPERSVQKGRLDV